MPASDIGAEWYASAADICRLHAALQVILFLIVLVQAFRSEVMDSNGAATMCGHVTTVSTRHVHRFEWPIRQRL